MGISIELKKRTLTAVLGVAALVCWILVGKSWAVFLFASALSLGMVYEFAGILFTLGDQFEKRYALLILAWVIVLANGIMSVADLGLLSFSFITLFSYFLLTAGRHSHDEMIKHFQECAYALFGVVYLVFLPFYFRRIYDLPQGVFWFFLFLLIVWASDVVAYFAGKRYGKRKLYPLISPKKTIEGALGGVLGAVLVSVLFKVLIFRALSWEAAFVSSILVSLTSQVGDLCESFFKRAFDKKDSSSILPGHGGLLDRFDGVIFSLPAMYACIRLLG